MELTTRGQRVVDDLVADSQRLGHMLPVERIERLCHKREISIPEQLAVEDELETRGLFCREEKSDAEPIEDLLEDEEFDLPVPSTIGTREHVEGNYPFHQITHAPLLEPSTVNALARRYALGVEAKKALAKGEVTNEDVRAKIDAALQARNKIVRHNMRLVVSVAKHYLRDGLDLLDLVQDGAVGLIRAAEKYDYRLGYRFSTYATWWIRQSITRAMHDRGRLVRYPVYRSEQISRLKKADRRLARLKQGISPTINQLASELEWDPTFVSFIRDLDAITTVPLDSPVPGTEDLKLTDILPVQDAQPAALTIQAEANEKMRQALAELPKRSAEVLEMRFGLDDNHPKTLEEIGRIYGVTRERIRQIQDKALRKLEHIVAKFGIDGYE